MEKIAKIGYSEIFKDDDPVSSLIFRAGFAIDADGSPRAYHPESRKGLDSLRNAGRPGRWYGLATDPAGKPYVQGAGDPAPGFYVSQTALEDRAFTPSDPRRYVDSEKVPFIVLPYGLRGGAVLGDYATVLNVRGGGYTAAIFADIGPRDAIGEGSIDLAERLDIDPSPRHGGLAHGLLYIVYAGSGDGHPKAVQEIESSGEELFRAWGGVERVKGLEV